MTFFVKQKVTNYFLLSAFQAPRLNRKGWGIKCLIYAVEGTPGHGEQLKGKGPRARPLGAESCPRPLVLKAGVCAPGVQKSRGKGALFPNSGSRQFKRETELQMDRVCTLRLFSAWEVPATACFFPREERVSGKGRWTFQKASRVV